MYYIIPISIPTGSGRNEEGDPGGFCREKGFPLLVEEEYDLSGFLRMVVEKENERCPLCYAMVGKRRRKPGSWGINGLGPPF